VAKANAMAYAKAKRPNAQSLGWYYYRERFDYYDLIADYTGHMPMDTIVRLVFQHGGVYERRLV
jgi:hypothetical protein